MRRYRHVPRIASILLLVLSLGLLGFHVQQGDTLTDPDAEEIHDDDDVSEQHAEAIAVAETYIFHGLVEHDGDKVLLADDALRTEQGRSTGDNAAAIRASLESPALQVVSGVKNLRWVVECNFDDVCHASAIFDLEIDAFGPRPPVLIAERFRVEDGLITEIEAIFVIQEDFGPCSGECHAPPELGRSLTATREHRSGPENGRVSIARPFSTRLLHTSGAEPSSRYGHVRSG